jgi:hypothetical protein
VSTGDIALNIKEISMSKITPTNNRTFQKIRKEARNLSKKLGIDLHKAQAITAKKFGFEHWKQLTDSKKIYDKRAEPCQNNPVFFWDPKDVQKLPSNSPWAYDYLAVEICHDLLWKKPRISRCLADREEWLAGVIYKRKWTSLKELHADASQLMFLSPSFVFISGCFIPFEELKRSADDIKTLESIETSLVIYDEVEPCLDKLRTGMSSGILDFSSQFDWDLPDTSLYGTKGWSAKQAGDHIADLYIEQVILISPPEDVLASIKLRIGDHLVQVVDLGF